MSKIAGAQGNIFEDAKNWPPIGTASLSGYERSRVLLNRGQAGFVDVAEQAGVTDRLDGRAVATADLRSEEHTSELQSLRHLVCRLLLEKKKQRDTLTS